MHRNKPSSFLRFDAPRFLTTYYRDATVSRAEGNLPVKHGTAETFGQAVDLLITDLQTGALAMKMQAAAEFREVLS